MDLKAVSPYLVMLLERTNIDTGLTGCYAYNVFRNYDSLGGDQVRCRI